MSDFKNIHDFTKSKSSKHAFQDPTYLSFLLLFDFTDNVHSPLLAGGAEAFLKKLTEGGDNSELYKEKLESLQNFKKALKTINNEMPWYWQGLSGLERIQQYNPDNAYLGGDDAKITITTLESINLTIAGLMHLYRKAVFDESKWSWVIPENLRKFRMYVYVTEVRAIKNMSSPNLTGFDPTQNPFKQDIKMQNSNADISGISGRPYFMFSLKYCEFDLDTGVTIFQDLKKSPEEAASGEISISYESLFDVEARVLNGIVEDTFNVDDLSPAPDSEDKSPATLKDWAKDQANQKLKDLEDRAVTEMKARATNRMNELKAEAKRRTVGRLNAAVNNIYQDFVQGVDRETDVIQQSNNIKAAIADNVYGLTDTETRVGDATVGDILNTAAKNSLGNVYGS